MSFPEPGSPEIDGAGGCLLLLMMILGGLFLVLGLLEIRSWSEALACLISVSGSHLGAGCY